MVIIEFHIIHCTYIAIVIYVCKFYDKFKNQVALLTNDVILIPRRVRFQSPIMCSSIYCLIILHVWSSGLAVSTPLPTSPRVVGSNPIWDNTLCDP